MADAFLGEVRLFPYGFAPIGWMLCDGRLLAINQYNVLYAVIGVTYGGNGQANFNLPNLIGATAVGQGLGPGLTNRVLATSVGEAAVTLTTSTMTPHTHQLSGFDNNAAGSVLTQAPAAGSYFTFPQTTADSSNAYSVSDTTANVALAPTSTTPATPTTSHDNQQPFLTFGYYMCMDGTFPVRP